MAAALFEEAARGEIQIVLHQMVISEMIYVLGNLYRGISRKARLYPFG